MSADCNKKFKCDKYSDLDDLNDENFVVYDDLKIKRIWNLPVVRQILVLLCPICCYFNAGLCHGTPTVLIPQIKARNEFAITNEMASWLYSIHGLGSLPTVLMMPYLSQRYGRRPICFAVTICFCVAWVLEYFATSFVSYLLAEIVQALAMGTNLVAVVFVAAEYSDPKYRGSVLFLKSASFYWGVWVANAIGTFTDTKNNCFVGFISAFVAFIVLIVSPESPVWLAAQGKYEESKTSFVSVRGTSKQAILEFRDMYEHYSKRDFKGHQYFSDTNCLSRIGKVLRLKSFYLPLSLSLVLFALCQFTGKTVITVYALVIVEQITHNKSLAYKTMLIIDGITVAGMYLGCYLVTKMRRRVLILSSTLVGALFMFLMSLLLFLSDFDVFKVNNVAILALLVLYTMAVTVGPIAAKTAIFVEIVPHRHKSFISSSGSIVFYVLHTVLLKSNGFLMGTIKLRSIFLLYASLMCCCSLFLYFYLPETKNKTLVEVERNFVDKNIYFNSNTIANDTEPVKIDDGKQH